MRIHRDGRSLASSEFQSQIVVTLFRMHQTEKRTPAIKTATPRFPIRSTWLETSPAGGYAVACDLGMKGFAVGHGFFMSCEGVSLRRLGSRLGCAARQEQMGLANL